MKYILCSLVFIISATCVSAKRFDYMYNWHLQPTPFSGMFLDKRILASKVIYNEFDVNGQPVSNEGACGAYSEEYTAYGHDPGGLIDTVVDIGGGCILVPRIHKYFTDGELKTIEFPLGTFSDFTYDEQGRILSITSGYSRSTIKEEAEITLYDYKANMITLESITEGVSTYSVICRIEYTDSGYVAAYEDGSVIEYIYDKQNRLIRGGDVLYTYTNNGFIKTEGDERTEYAFEEHGYMSESKRYKKELDSWVFTGSSQSTYIFSPPLANEPVIHTDKVYGVDGALSVELSESLQVVVYSLDGQLVISQWIEGGEPVSILLPKGFYIIRTDNGSYKVVVK